MFVSQERIFISRKEANVFDEPFDSIQIFQ